MSAYAGSEDHRHDAPPCAGILLSNLGTPDAANAAALRRYLAEFLSDPRIIELPRLLWWFVLHGFILRTRPARSAQAYQKIWTDEGSPLLGVSKRQAAAVQTTLAEQFSAPIRVELAMRYGQPSIAKALEKLRRAKVQRLLIFPLYPQYSATTTASTFDAVADVLKTWRWLPELRMVRNYHDHSGYIDALVQSICEHWARHDRPDKFLFSFHGLPRHYFLAGDPYFCECQKTARLVAEQLELNDDQWEVSFQSRFGPRQWLQPYTDKLLQQWGKTGIEHVQIICPGFSADCLETLEEINLQNRHFFLNAGGKRFSYIPALNDRAIHISALTDIIGKHTHGWAEFSGEWDAQTVDEESRLRQGRVDTLKKDMA